MHKMPHEEHLSHELPPPIVFYALDKVDEFYSELCDYVVTQDHYTGQVRVDLELFCGYGEGTRTERVLIDLEGLIKWREEGRYLDHLPEDGEAAWVAGVLTLVAVGVFVVAVIWAISSV